MGRRLVRTLPVAVVLLAACGSESDDGRSRRATPQPAAQSVPVARKPDGPYVGQWVGDLTEREASRRGDSRLAGRFRLELRPDGTYTTFQELDGENHGEYRASGGRLVFGHDDGCEYGGRAPSTGVYAWEVRGDRLRLAPDPGERGDCFGRTQSLTYPVWRRR